MTPLLNRYAGQTATVVGRGPSLLGLTAKDFVPGPVFTLNYAILNVRKLHLPNPILAMWKDGCGTPPEKPETLILSQAQSRKCFPTYEPRYVIDVRKLGLGVHSMSLTMAVALAKHMGCKEVRVLACDSAINGDLRMVRGDEIVPGERGYLWAANQAKGYAAKVKIPMVWA